MIHDPVFVSVGSLPPDRESYFVGDNNVGPRGLHFRSRALIPDPEETRVCRHYERDLNTRFVFFFFLWIWGPRSSFLYHLFARSLEKEKKRTVWGSRSSLLTVCCRP